MEAAARVQPARCAQTAAAGPTLPPRLIQTGNWPHPQHSSACTLPQPHPHKGDLSLREGCSTRPPTSPAAAARRFLSPAVSLPPAALRLCSTCGRAAALGQSRQAGAGGQEPQRSAALAGKRAGGRERTGPPRSFSSAAGLASGGVSVIPCGSKRGEGGGLGLAGPRDSANLLEPWQLPLGPAQQPHCSQSHLQEAPFGSQQPFQGVAGQRGIRHSCCWLARARWRCCVVAWSVVAASRTGLSCNSGRGKRLYLNWLCDPRCPF